MIINGVEIDPARNPGTLDTLTWDPETALQHIRKNQNDLQAIQNAAMGSRSVEAFQKKLAAVQTRGIRFFEGSVCLRDGTGYLLAGLPDGQRVILSASLSGNSPPLDVIGELSIGWLKAFISPVNTRTAAAFLVHVEPSFGPRSLGPVGRLGIGNRQTVTVWPGIFAAMRELGRPAEVIQNSAYRELAPMEFILAPPSKEAAYLPGHGSLSIGHTGTSIEGLWLSGVMSAVEHGFRQEYGADLDHIPVKSLDERGIALARRLILAGRHFTFFTLDTSFLFRPQELDLSRRYGDAVEAGVEIYEYIKSLKEGTSFDFEFSLDEGPALTTPEEQEFVLKALTDRGVKVDFIAPNVGFQKRIDYCLPDGLDALEKRVREMSECAARYGALLDFHSGSDKASETYRTIARACAGKLKLKVSGKLQLILAEVLADTEAEFFNFWWDWTLETARAEARQGSEVAARYVGLVEKRRAEEGQSFRRSPKDPFFTDFSFAMVGAKNDDGSFMFRDRFYNLSPETEAEYTRRVKQYVLDLADDLGLAN